MFKSLILTLVVAVASFGALVVTNKPVSAQAQERVTICHRTNSASNPYNQQTVAHSAVDGQGNNDHTLHTGPVATSNAHAANFKANNINWGDIVPPTPPALPNGLNWDTEGQGVYNSSCVTLDGVSVDVSCQDGRNTINAVVTLTNNSQYQQTVWVNGDPYSLDPGETVEITLPGNENIEIVVSEETVYDENPMCFGGRGSGTTTTTESTPEETQVSEVPESGVNAGGGSVVLAAGSLLASVTAFAYGILRLRKSSL